MYGPSRLPQIHMAARSTVEKHYRLAARILGAVLLKPCSTSRPVLVRSGKTSAGESDRYFLEFVQLEFPPRPDDTLRKLDWKKNLQRLLDARGLTNAEPEYGNSYRRPVSSGVILKPSTSRNLVPVCPFRINSDQRRPSSTRTTM